MTLEEEFAEANKTAEVVFKLLIDEYRKEKEKIFKELISKAESAAELYGAKFSFNEDEDHGMYYTPKSAEKFTEIDYHIQIEILKKLKLNHYDKIVEFYPNEEDEFIFGWRESGQ